ncbi:hypothetical protein QBC45DRAFT_427739 [Copromyces sp. CBS 386.78]|nr:hypothetical protein QBC45DRAFT_427739 [Copromyces sp. CBS 386.78]
MGNCFAIILAFIFFPAALPRLLSSLNSHLLYPIPPYRMFSCIPSTERHTPIAKKKGPSALQWFESRPISQRCAK